MNWEREASTRLPGLLEGWLKAPVSPEPVPEHLGLAYQIAGWRFVVEVKGSDNVATLDRAATALHKTVVGPHTIPVVVVPFMGPKARAWAEERGLSWIDLSGNAAVRAEFFFILVQGEPNAYATPGRPSNPFTPRYSRVSRALLAHDERWWKQSDLAREVDLPSGTVSKVVGRLRALELLESSSEGELRARAPSLLLDAWAQRYRFGGHALRRYHVPARSGVEAMEALARRLDHVGCEWVATGLSAAWHYTRHTDFRLNTFFVQEHPVDPQALGLRPVERGENVWLIVPSDDGVFYEKVQRGIQCAHPVQVYLDLQALPERAAEAAAELRKMMMTWRA
jgi:hypothetical protein